MIAVVALVLISAISTYLILPKPLNARIAVSPNISKLPVGPNANVKEISLSVETKEGIERLKFQWSVYGEVGHLGQDNKSTVTYIPPDDLPKSLEKNVKILVEITDSLDKLRPNNVGKKFTLLSLIKLDRILEETILAFSFVGQQDIRFEPGEWKRSDLTEKQKLDIKSFIEDVIKKKSDKRASSLRFTVTCYADQDRIVSQRLVEELLVGVISEKIPQDHKMYEEFLNLRLSEKRSNTTCAYIQGLLAERGQPAEYTSIESIVGENRVCTIDSYLKFD